MLVLCAQHAAAGFIVRTLELGAFRPEFGARRVNVGTSRTPAGLRKLRHTVR
jgi:hypothetical protein